MGFLFRLSFGINYRDNIVSRIEMKKGKTNLIVQKGDIVK